MAKSKETPKAGEQHATKGLKHYALVAGAAVTAPMAAHAGIIYTPVNITFLGTPGGTTYGLDVNGDSADDLFFFVESDFAGVLPAKNLAVSNATSSFVVSPSGFPTNLPTGATVDATSTFQSFIGTGILSQENTKGYEFPTDGLTYGTYGFEFTQPDGTHYGYLNLTTLLGSPTSTTDKIIISGIGYETDPATAVNPTQNPSTPEPSSLPMFALGAARLGDVAALAFPRTQERTALGDGLPRMNPAPQSVRISPEHRLADRVVLVNWRGADWRTISSLLEAGLMPNLKQLVETGILATDVPALTDACFTTGIQTKQVGRPIWNVLDDYGARAVAIGWPGPATRTQTGVSISSDYFRGVIHGTAALNSAFPEDYGSRMTRWCMRPEEIKRKDLAPFVPALRDIDPQDPRVRTLAGVLVRAVSTHAVATYLMEKERADFFTVCYDFMEAMIVGLGRFGDFGPGDLFYEKACGAAYGFSDMMLGRILQLAGDAAVILCSTQGYQLADGGSRYEATPGFFCLRSRGVKADELVHDSSLLDLAPTILTALGFPTYPGMEGQFLERAFEAVPA